MSNMDPATRFLIDACGIDPKSQRATIELLPGHPPQVTVEYLVLTEPANPLVQRFRLAPDSTDREDA